MKNITKIIDLKIEIKKLENQIKIFNEQKMYMLSNIIFEQLYFTKQELKRENK